MAAPAPALAPALAADKAAVFAAYGGRTGPEKRAAPVGHGVAPAPATGATGASVRSALALACALVVLLAALTGTLTVLLPRRNVLTRLGMSLAGSPASDLELGTEAKPEPGLDPYRGSSARPASGNVGEEAVIRDTGDGPSGGLESEDPPSGPAEELPPPELQHKASPLSWWIDDPPGMDGRERGTSRRYIWEYELSREVNASRTAGQRRRPQLVFIKGLKVGGTSIALALDKAARRYGIKLQDTVSSEDARRGVVAPNVPCNPDRSLFFHHASLAPWMSRCVPNARFVTVLREPVSQTLSWETMALNADYYNNYPAVACDPPGRVQRGVSTAHQLRHIMKCVDSPLRRNLTMRAIAVRISSNWRQANPGEAVVLTSRWVTGLSTRYTRLTGRKVIAELESRYFLVGVSERINEFLVLLALHNGWDLSAMMYRRCKTTDIEVTKPAFAAEYPELAARLEVAVRPMAEAYAWARDRFDEHVRRMPAWFPDMVKRYEGMLAEYQKLWEVPGRPFKWRVTWYGDGKWEAC